MPIINSLSEVVRRLVGTNNNSPSKAPPSPSSSSGKAAEPSISKAIVAPTPKPAVVVHPPVVAVTANPAPAKAYPPKVQAIVTKISNLTKLAANTAAFDAKLTECQQALSAAKDDKAKLEVQKKFSEECVHTLYSQALITEKNIIGLEIDGLEGRYEKYQNELSDQLAAINLKGYEDKIDAMQRQINGEPASASSSVAVSQPYTFR